MNHAVQDKGLCRIFLDTEKKTVIVKKTEEIRIYIWEMISREIR